VAAEGPWSDPREPDLQGLSQSNPSRTSQTDQALAQYIWPSIADCDGRDNGQVIEYPRLDWRACSPSNVSACADELETEALRLCQFVGSFAGTTTLSPECQLQW